jgi:hypothetical protein
MLLDLKASGLAGVIEGMSAKDEWDAAEGRMKGVGGNGIFSGAATRTANRGRVSVQRTRAPVAKMHVR